VGKEEMGPEDRSGLSEPPTKLLVMLIKGDEF
jgi:hypothetical protein